MIRTRTSSEKGFDPLSLKNHFKHKVKCCKSQLLVNDIHYFYILRRAAFQTQLLAEASYGTNTNRMEKNSDKQYTSYNSLVLR